MKDFITPPSHINFLAKKLFSGIEGEIADGSVAYLEKGGGGPEQPHKHEHDHLFIVVKGEAKILFEDETVIIKENESYLVKGARSHSVWNAAESETIMIGITVLHKKTF